MLNSVRAATPKAHVCAQQRHLSIVGIFIKYNHNRGQKERNSQTKDGSNSAEEAKGLLSEAERHNNQFKRLKQAEHVAYARSGNEAINHAAQK